MAERHLGTMNTAIPDNTVLVNGKPIKHRVRPRDEARVAMEIEVTPTNGKLVGGQRIPKGKHVVIVYKSQVQSVLDMVMQPEHLAAWERATKNHERKLEAYLLDALGKPEAMKPAEYALHRERAIETYGATTPSSLFEIEYPKLNRPLMSAKVLEELAPPETPETKQRTQTENLLRDLVSALLSANGKTKGEKRAEG